MHTYIQFKIHLHTYTYLNIYIYIYTYIRVQCLFVLLQKPEQTYFKHMQHIYIYILIYTYKFMYLFTHLENHTLRSITLFKQMPIYLPGIHISYQVFRSTFPRKQFQKHGLPANVAFWGNVFCSLTPAALQAVGS